MFTGIIETTAAVGGHNKNGEALTLSIEKPTKWKLNLGQSISVNGACLTVVAFNKTTFTVELVPETLEKTIFGQCLPETVNLERAMLATDRFEGHIVQGHIDTVGEVTEVKSTAEVTDLVVKFDPRFDKQVVSKGSVALDGVSLTVVDVKSGCLSVTLIPHTLKETTLSELAPQDKINIEFDIVGKYLSR